MKSSFLGLALAAALGGATLSSAQLVPVSIAASDTVLGPLERVADGILPEERSAGISIPLGDFGATVFWSKSQSSLTLDYGSHHLVRDLLLSVDFNDRYLVDYSLDGVNFVNLLTVQKTYGEVEAVQGNGLLDRVARRLQNEAGLMDTLSSDALSAEYVAGIDFTPTTLRYLRVRGQDGTGIYALGELQAFGQPVPEPSTYGILGALALGALIWQRRRRA